MTFNQDLFEHLSCVAEQALQTVPAETYTQTQAVVLLTAKGKLHSKVLTLSQEGCDELFQTLVADDDTRVDALLCMWRSGEIDVPSYLFRRKLWQLADENGDTRMFLSAGEGGFVTKRLKDTMPGERLL